MSGRRRQYRTRLVRTVQRVVGSALVALLIAGGSISAEESPKNEPSLVLVLSGGGARGIAHIGVIRVLEELQIAPDLVIGTSMGSIIGGLYAAGWSAADMQELVEAIDWEDVFTDRVDRQKRSFRRKQDDRPIMIQGRLHFNGLKPVMPSGVIDGQRLELLLRTVEALSPATTDFDELPIPYRAVAADIATGEAVVIGSGSLAEAMRASMSVPGVLPPVAIDGRNLVDGGIAANLPVGIAKELGAQLIIAVDISSPLLKEEGEEFETFMSLYSLGGLLRLSGLGNQELLGEKIAFARLVGYRRLFNFDLAGMKVSIYTGLSLEAGNAYLDEESPAWGNMVKAFSVFIGGDTFVGPVVFAYGRADGNRDRFYLAIGGTF